MKNTKTQNEINDEKESKEDAYNEKECESCECKDWEEKYKRALADYQNLEKRSAEERKTFILSANKGLLLRLLPILDTLHLAAKHSEDKTIAVCVGQFNEVLKNEGVEKIQVEGKEFDPSTMEVISTKDGEEGKVLEEVRSGYLLGEKVLRVAQVLVGSAKQN